MNSRQLVILTQEYAPFPSLEATHATGVVSTLRWLACDVVVIASAYSDDDLDAMGAEESDLGVIFVCYFAKGSNSGGSLRSHVGILSSLNETFFSQRELAQALFDLSLVTPACMWPNPSIAVGPIAHRRDNSTETSLDQLGSASSDFEPPPWHYDVTTRAVKQNASQPHATETPRVFRERLADPCSLKAPSL